jgi:glycosyltransferase involved in cell wall biosynthesis
MNDSPSPEPRPPDRARPLLLIVAYEAEPQLPELIGRLARVDGMKEFWSILLLDDSSRDRTSVRAKELFAQHGFCAWRVVRNEENQGYGGNQKVGYRYALKVGGFTHVALLHGDCQYPPEALPVMLDEATRTGAGVVLASRMWSIRSARRGGMPLYKIIGNRVLTWIQNRLTGRRLKEYHTGMRMYSTEFLARVPFELNSDGFDFDTEILLQSFYVDAGASEIKIPTRYAGEICRVPGIRYALCVLRSSVDFWLQTHGMGISLRFRDLQGRRMLHVDRTRFEGSAHEAALRAILDSRPQAVLDLGCGQGFVGARAKASLPHLRYDGVDRALLHPSACDRYWSCDLDSGLPPTNPFDYDMVLCLDVLEQLSEPEAFLLRLRESSRGNKDTLFLFSTANVAFLSIRLGLLVGHFAYGDRGILDIRHRRLMSRTSFKRLIRETGFVIERSHGTPVPFQLVFGDGRLARFMTRLWRVLALLFPGPLSFQTVIEARARRLIPDVALTTEEESASRTSERSVAGGGVRR